MPYNQNSMIAVGFGDAVVTCDGRVVYSESDHDHDGRFWTFGTALTEARKQPECRWEITLRAPLWNELWRFDGSDWVLIERGEGFA